MKQIGWMKRWSLVTGLVVVSFVLMSCNGEQNNLSDVAVKHEQSINGNVLTLPEIETLELDGRPLKVVATTSIIGDVVAQVGGDQIELITLIEPGQDPHSYEPGAGDLTTVSTSDVIFVNGWNLEEGLADDLTAISENTPIVPVNANVDPLEFDDNDTATHDHENEGESENHGWIDPHTWFAVSNVRQWVKNIATVLSELDPGNKAHHQDNGRIYDSLLEELDMTLRRQIEQIPQEERILISNHESLGYLAHEYDFEIIGTVMPSSSTLAEPSARDLAALASLMDLEGICAIYTETTVSDTLPQTLAQELNHCEQVKIIPLYTGSIGLPGSGADTYQGTMESNISAIVEGLQ